MRQNGKPQVFGPPMRGVQGGEGGKEPENRRKFFPRRRRARELGTLQNFLRPPGPIDQLFAERSLWNIDSGSASLRLDGRSHCNCR
jgi:hypothetical protein